LVDKILLTTLFQRNCLKNHIPATAGRFFLKFIIGGDLIKSKNALITVFAGNDYNRTFALFKK